MSDEDRKYTKKVIKSDKSNSAKPVLKNKLPTQNGPRDTTNWDNKVYKAPDGRRIIETEQSVKESPIRE